MDHLGLVEAQHEEGGVCNQLHKWSLGFRLLSEGLAQRCICLCTGGKPALRNSSSRSQAERAMGRGGGQGRSALTQLCPSHPLPTEPPHKEGSSKVHCHLSQRKETGKGHPVTILTVCLQGQLLKPRAFATSPFLPKSFF